MVVSKAMVLRLLKDGHWQKAGTEILKMEPGVPRDQLLKKLVRHYLERNQLGLAVDFAAKVSDLDNRDEVLAEIIMAAIEKKDWTVTDHILNMVPRKDRGYLRVVVFKLAEKQCGRKKWQHACFYVRVCQKLPKKHREWFLEGAKFYVDEEIWDQVTLAIFLDNLLSRK